MQRKKRILFITHEASISGAPILFLSLIRVVKGFDEYDIHIMCAKDGPLLDKFRECAPTVCLKSADYRKEKSFVKAIINKITFLSKLLYFLPVWLRTDIVFNNTISNGLIIKFYFKFKKKRVLSYIHELEKYTRTETQWREAIHIFRLSDRFISPSSYNKNLFSEVFNLPVQRFRLLPYVVSNNLSAEINSNIEVHKLDARDRLLKKYGIPSDSLLVLGMGTFDKRKGIDYFIETASLLQNKSCSFFWIGDGPKHHKDEMQILINDKKINNFYPLGEMPHDLSNFFPFDLFFLSSREDPYPLVVLEAAAVGIPSVCFAKSGGIIDFVSDDSGWIIEDFSVVDAASLIGNLSQSVIREKGLNAMTKVASLHLDKHMIHSRFQGIIEEAYNEIE